MRPPKRLVGSSVGSGGQDLQLFLNDFCVFDGSPNPEWRQNLERSGDSAQNEFWMIGLICVDGQNLVNH